MPDLVAERDAIERHIRERGVVHCPPAHAAPSQQGVPNADIIALPFMWRDYRTGRWSRAPKKAGFRRILSLNLR